MTKESTVIALMALQFLYGQNTKLINQAASLPDPGDYFGMSDEERKEFLSSRDLDPKAGVGFYPENYLDRAADWYRKLKYKGVQFLTREDPDYPVNLEQRHDPEAPALLYVLSASPAGELFRERTAVSVVGTRDASPYGLHITSQAVADLATLDPRPVIVSGLALGIDARAHRSALENRLPTVAVLPTGIDNVYPIAHRELAEQISSTPGCALITDYPPETAPIAFNFLRRNRIIAALGDVLILPESKQKGGGMVTARLAADKNRQVFAVPGRLTDPRSAGCNELIAQGVADILPDTALLTKWCQEKWNIEVS